MSWAEFDGALAFEPVPGGTRMSWSWEVAPKGWLRWLWPVVGPVVGLVGRRQEAATWASLKRQLEGAQLEGTQLEGPQLEGPQIGATRLELARGGWRRLLPQGFFRAVDYSVPGRYRRPPRAYARVQRIAPAVTWLGLSPRYVITLEVPGRRTGVIRRTSLVRATLDGSAYLVALAGESEWVRNVRAADGRVVVGRRVRRAATLVELPVAERPRVIRAYLMRAGRRPGSARMAAEARAYFGVGADPSLEEIAAVAERYPVFRIVCTTPHR
jgi:deazaflavin-dependent oxidoreductase (nitroreductase family)